MNRFVQYMMAAVLCAVAVVSCDTVGVGFTYEPENRSSLYIKGEPVIIVADVNVQYSFNRERNEYRTMDDTMGNYFILKCDRSLSSVGQYVKADLSYTTKDNIKVLNGLEYEIKIIDESEGLICLWNEAKKVKVIVRQF